MSNLSKQTLDSLRADRAWCEQHGAQLWPHLKGVPVNDYPLTEFCFIWTWFHLHHKNKISVRPVQVKPATSVSIREYKPRTLRSKYGDRCRRMLTRQRKAFGLQDKVLKPATEKRTEAYRVSDRQEDYLGTHSLLLKDLFFEAIQNKAIEKHNYFGICLLDGKVQPSWVDSEDQISARDHERKSREQGL